MLSHGAAQSGGAIAKDTDRRHRQGHHLGILGDGVRGRATPPAKALGVKIDELGAHAEDDAAGEVIDPRKRRAANPTAIVVAATNAQALAQPIARATEAGIPVIMIDSRRQYRRIRDVPGHQQ